MTPDAILDSGIKEKLEVAYCAIHSVDDLDVCPSGFVGLGSQGPTEAEGACLFTLHQRC